MYRQTGHYSFGSLVKHGRAHSRLEKDRAAQRDAGGEEMC